MTSDASTMTGEMVIGRLRFKGIEAGIGRLTFDFIHGSRNDSNLAACETSEDTLASVIDAYYNIVSSADLVPYQGLDWEYPIVPSSVQGTISSTTLFEGQPTYLDWGVSNPGNITGGGLFYVDLFLDNTRIVLATRQVQVK